jgi:hypothetical protein
MIPQYLKGRRIRERRAPPCIRFIKQAQTPPTATEVEKAEMLDGHTQKAVRAPLHRRTAADEGQGASDNIGRLTAGRNRLRGEVENLVRSIAAGVPADTVAPGIRQRELESSRIEARLRAPHEQPNIEGCVTRQHSPKRYRKYKMWRPQRDSNPCFGLEREKQGDPDGQ